MSKLLMSLLAVTAFLTLAPTAASALPPQCYEVCDFTSDCSDVCAQNNRFSNCGAYGICAMVHEEPLDETASVTLDEETLVCSEPRQVTTELGIGSAATGPSNITEEQSRCIYECQNAGGEYRACWNCCVLKACPVD